APRTDWPALQKLKIAFQDGIPEGQVKDFQDSGIETFAGRATLNGPRSIEVDGETLEADNIVLATGARPRKTDIPGSELAKNSEYFLNLESLPKRVLFVGGGYISFEFAHVAAQAGAEVTILHRSECPLKAFDRDIVKTVVEASEDSGIRIILKESPTRIESTDNQFRVHGSSGAIYETDLVIEASGRVPNLSVLDGDLGGVEHSSRGIEVNEFLQSVSNPNVYAIGDCAATPYQLATVADEEGKVAAENILNDNRRSVDYSVIPTAGFTIPNVASVGLTEKQAEEKNLDFRIESGVTTGWPSSNRIGEKHSAYKILISNEDDTIIGAHLARHNASEVISSFGLAMKYRIPASELANFPWAYPTYTSDLKYMVR
ncbi:MAG TPA: NAD(P)/FAD-dependent oxidoreductase, partial [Opitutae bacterium]|nr:NAD(P)/FAD-dependent oxidoreductase [Opitutae bacterium]